MYDVCMYVFLYFMLLCINNKGGKHIHSTKTHNKKDVLEVEVEVDVNVVPSVTG